VLMFVRYLKLGQSRSDRREFELQYIVYLQRNVSELPTPN
jgi:hypothetical protein